MAAWELVAKIAAAASLALSGGCLPPNSGVVGVRSQGQTWSVRADDAVPGIHKGGVERVTMKTGGPADVHFAVWGDVSATRSSNESQRGAAVANGYVQTTEGIRVPYRCEVGGDGTARMTIGGRSYDVKDGALFLISTRGVTAPSSKPLVRQVAVDLTRLPNESDELIAYAKEHGEIERFFTDAADGDKADDPPR